jgi:phosphatidylserine/phosphatidylglycerophosphate/cardiolipin synthase-like enzyme
MLRQETLRIRIIRLGLILPAVFALGWGVSHRADISAKAPPAPTATLPAGPVAVYFSRPQEFDGEYRGGPDEPLARAIAGARCCVDIASYDFNLLSVARALIAASARGVTVRVVVDSDNWHNEALDLMRGQGIPIAGDGREGLMHDKFVVIDREDVWAGSMNLTVNDSYRNDNNLLHLRSPKLGGIFTTEFEEMFLGRFFGTDSPRGKTAASVDTDAGPVQALFAPEDRVAGHLIELIQCAKKSIRFLAFSFTSAPIADEIIESAAHGVSVSGIMETSQAKSSSAAQWDRLRHNGATVYLDANPRNMHHKVILIDGEIVATGSYNFSESAENKNDEDLLIFWNPALADAFEAEFQRIYDMAVRKAQAVERFNGLGVPPVLEFSSREFQASLPRGI